MSDQDVAGTALHRERANGFRRALREALTKLLAAESRALKAEERARELEGKCAGLSGVINRLSVEGGEWRAAAHAAEDRVRHLTEALGAAMPLIRFMARQGGDFAVERLAQCEAALSSTDDGERCYAETIRRTLLSAEGGSK